ncbi:hypothetical protein [Microbacterium maritypicum]|uniref:hypothetical protein n=1 Tax=Microbacterium maritypicum TaxID=33918 RepID=UPI0003F935C4|nr:hypothetical protein [Microbacterium liquefaciens]
MLTVGQYSRPERGDRRIRVDEPRFVDGTAFYQVECGAAPPAKGSIQISMGISLICPVNMSPSIGAMDAFPPG